MKKMNNNFQDYSFRPRSLPLATRLTYISIFTWPRYTELIVLFYITIDLSLIAACFALSNDSPLGLVKQFLKMLK